MKKPKPLRKLEKLKKKYIQQKGKCALCGFGLEKELAEFENWIMENLTGKGVTKRRHLIDINYDHIIPRSKGGKNSKSNKQLTHQSCNSKKGNNPYYPLFPNCG